MHTLSAQTFATTPTPDQNLFAAHWTHEPDDVFRRYPLAHVPAFVVDAQLKALASQAEPAHTPAEFRYLLAAHWTHVPSVWSWYPDAQLAAVVLDAHVAALAEQTAPWQLPFPEFPDAVRNLFNGQDTHVPFADSW